MQELPGAPGTARQESPRTIVSTYDGGTATQPRAPGHERPRAALCAARHGRLSAASTAPGADIPHAIPARAPGQYCQSAALKAPGHGRPLATMAGVSGHDRLSAASIATVTSPAGQYRLRQEDLPRTPATPNATVVLPAAHRHARHRPHRVPPRYQERAIPRKSECTPLHMVERGRGRGTAAPHLALSVRLRPVTG